MQRIAGPIVGTSQRTKRQAASGRKRICTEIKSEKETVPLYVDQQKLGTTKTSGNCLVSEKMAIRNQLSNFQELTRPFHDPSDCFIHTLSHRLEPLTWSPSAPVDVPLHTPRDQAISADWDT